MIIFDQDEQKFDTFGLGMLIPSSGEVYEEVNGDFTLNFQHPYDTSGKWKRIEIDRIVLAETPRGKQPFRIYYHKPTMDGIEVQARHLFYDLLDNICESVAYSGSAQGAMDAIKEGLSVPMPFTFHTDIACDTGSIGCTMDNPVSLLLREEWDDQEGETKSFFRFYGGELKRDFFNVSMLESLGSDRGVFIAYSKNLVGLEVTEDISDVGTRIYPIGKDGLTLSGQYIDSPYIGNYPYPKIRVIEDTNVESQSDLQKIAEDYYANGGDIPKVNIKVDFTDLSQTEEYKQYSNLEKVFLGDTVTVFNQKMGFSKKAKVISYKFDPILKKYKSMELGDFSPTVTSPITRGANAGQIANTAYGKSNNAEILLQNHLNDFNNPHRVTAEQVGGGGIGGGNTVLHGTEAPSNDLGNDGDYYIKDEVKGVADENTLLLIHGTSVDESKTSVPLLNQNVISTQKDGSLNQNVLKFSENTKLTTENGLFLNIPNSDFTIEWRGFAERLSSIPGEPLSISNPSSSVYFNVELNEGNKIFIWENNTGGNYVGNYEFNKWMHFAVVKNGNKLYFYVDGVKSFERDFPYNLTYAEGTVVCLGGSIASGLEERNYIGYLEEFRISNIARWTSNFTPPTEPYTVYQNAESGEIYVKESGTWKKILTGMK